MKDGVNIMTVQDYLKVVNSVYGNDDGKFITAGFIDIVPNIEDLPYTKLGVADFRVDSENIVVKREVTTERGEFFLERTTSLSDDISLHCGVYETPEQLLNNTIAFLTGVKETYMYFSYSEEKINKVQKSIDVITSFLDGYQQNITTGSSKKSV